MKVSLADVVFDAGTQIRAAIDERVVAEYAELMTEGITFPAIVLFHDGNQHYLADGFHRFMAARRNQFRDIEADVRPGTKTDAIWYALGANTTNGHRMTFADRRHAIELALRTWGDSKTATEVAKHMGIAQQRVSEVRAKLQSTDSGRLYSPVVRSDGKSYPAGPAAASDKRQRIAELLKSGSTTKEIREAVGGASHTTITKVRKEIGQGVLPSRDRDAIVQRRKDVEDMAARGYMTRQIAKALGLSEDRVRTIAKEDGVVIHADRVVGKVKHHDASRILERMSQQAENLCADVNLIDFDAIDATQIKQWLSIFKTAREELGGVIRRLMKEQQKHGEAA